MLQLTDQWVDELSFRSFLLIKSHSKEAQCWFYIEKFTAVLPSSTKTMMKNYEEYEEMFLYSKTKCNGVFRRSSSIHTPKTFTCLIWVLNPEFMSCDVWREHVMTAVDQCGEFYLLSVNQNIQLWTLCLFHIIHILQSFYFSLWWILCFRGTIWGCKLNNSAIWITRLRKQSILSSQISTFMEFINCFYLSGSVEGMRPKRFILSFTAQSCWCFGFTNSWNIF